MQAESLKEHEDIRTKCILHVPHHAFLGSDATASCLQSRFDSATGGLSVGSTGEVREGRLLEFPLSDLLLAAALRS